MSLHHIAKHLQEQGRGPDDMLVHMTSGELGAMQQLAKAHGGSLTINPKTGLPEAGFLSAILPMAAGALAVALAPETGGMSLEAYSALAAGGIGLADYAITGSLTQGLMAGLSAYGGAGLAGGIAGLGSAAADAANPEIIAQQLGVTGAATGPGSQAAMLAQQNAGLGADALNATREAAATAIPAGAQTAAQAAAAAAPAGTAIQQAPIQNQFLSGLQSGNVMNYMGNHLGQVAAAALPAVMSSGNLFGQKSNVPGVTAQKNPFGMKEIPTDANGKPIFNASNPTVPNPHYQAVYPNYVANPYNAYTGTPAAMSPGATTYMASGGLSQDATDYASGGMYPGSQIDKTQYASSPQMPASMQQTMAGYDPMTNPLTGEEVQHMADGGVPYIQQAQNKPATANGYTPAGGGSTYGQGSYSPQTAAAQPMEGGLPMLSQMNPFTQQGMPPQVVPAPQTNFAMGGVARYAGNPDFGSMVSGQNEVQSGLEMATRRPLMQTPTPDVGIYTPEAAVRDMDPLQSTMYYLNKVAAPVPKGLASLQKPATLGAITHKPAAEQAAEAAAKADITKSSEKEVTAKEGGLMGMAAGGSPVYHPQYANYAQTPYQAQQSTLTPAQLQAVNQYYLQQNIPIPTRSSAIPAQGYKLDPSLMQSNSQIAAAIQAKLDSQNAAAAIASGGSNDGGGDGGGGDGGGGDGGDAKGGYFLHNQFNYHPQHMATGGLPMSNLGGYSDGGHLLKGPGDGVSDSIPATIGGKQPARLAEGEFVIPARIVSELGNGSTDAGAKRLYAMMDRIKAKRAKTKNIAADTKAYKYLPA